REIQDPGNGIPGLPQDIAAKDVGGAESRPQPGDNLGHQRKIVATRGQGRAINRSGGSAFYYRKRIAVGLNTWYFSNAFEDPSLISPARTAACHHQTQHVFHLPTSCDRRCENPRRSNSSRQLRLICRFRRAALPWPRAFGTLSPTVLRARTAPPWKSCRHRHRPGWIFGLRSLCLRCPPCSAASATLYDARRRTVRAAAKSPGIRPPL